MKSKQLILFILFSCVFLRSYAQPESDSLKINALLEKALKIRLNQPDSAIYYAKAAMSNTNPESNYLNGFAYYILSYSHWVKANYKLSTEYGYRSLKYLEETNFHYEKSLILLGLCRTFIDLGSHKEGKKYLDRVNNIANDQLDDKRIIANYFRELSFYYLNINKPDSSLLAADKGLEIYITRKDTLNTSILYSRKTRILTSQKKFTEAMQLSRQSLLLDSLVKNRRALGVAKLQVGIIHYELGNYDSALYFLNRSIVINKEIGNLQALYNTSKQLSEVYVAIKLPLLAVAKLKEAAVYKDSLYNAQSSGQIEEMRALYETERKDNTIQLLEKEKALSNQQRKNTKLIVGILVLIIVFFWVLIYLLVRNQRLQKKTNTELQAKNQSIEQQKEEMQLQSEKLHGLNQLKSKLFSVISHDLRGPINNLQSLLDLFTKNLLTQQEFIQHSDKLKASVNITQRTLENLLNWSLSQMEGIRTRPSLMDIKSSADEAAKLLNDVASRKNISIENKIATANLVYADPDQVQLILRNLIHNGIKFSTSDSVVVITASNQENFCSISVMDSGIGMTNEEISKLAIAKEHFTKIGTLQEKGTGLGLLLCKEFVERNGGVLSIKSEAGKGTAITFTLPLA